MENSEGAFLIKLTLLPFLLGLFVGGIVAWLLRESKFRVGTQVSIATQVSALIIFSILWLIDTSGTQGQGQVITIVITGLIPVFMSFMGAVAICYMIENNKS